MNIIKYAIFLVQMEHIFLQKNNNLCVKDFKCDKYYNYDKTDCLEEVPEGYYLNDSEHKTIDKCPIKCNECSLESISQNLCI